MPATTARQYFGRSSDIDPTQELHSPPGPGVTSVANAKWRVVENLSEGPTFWIWIIARAQEAEPFEAEAAPFSSALREVSFHIDESERYPQAYYIPYEEAPEEEW
jgi:hypothetical protein